MKKGQGLSMNVIIIAAIALLVLVILAMIFIGRMTTQEEKIDAVAIEYGDCVEVSICAIQTHAYCNVEGNCTGSAIIDCNETQLDTYGSEVIYPSEIKNLESIHIAHKGNCIRR